MSFAKVFMAVLPACLSAASDKAPHECHGFKPVLYSRVFWSLKARPVPVLSAIRTDHIRGWQPADARVLADSVSYSWMDQVKWQYIYVGACSICAQMSCNDRLMLMYQTADATLIEN